MSEETITLEDSYFPTWDLTMYSITLYDTAERLKQVIEAMKTSSAYFINKSEAIANAMLALRAIEEAEFRVLRAKKNING